MFFSAHHASSARPNARLVMLLDSISIAGIVGLFVVVV